jgi:hypothetical protein
LTGRRTDRQGRGEKKLAWLEEKRIAGQDKANLPDMLATATAIEPGRKNILKNTDTKTGRNFNNAEFSRNHPLIENFDPYQELIRLVRRFAILLFACKTVSRNRPYYDY